MHQKSIYNAFDLNKAVPGLATIPDQAAGSLPSFSIRGRGQSYGAASGSVETYFADVPLSPPFQSPTLPPQFFDLQSVQVLKGPQGTLFGRNSTGGAVLFVPQAPTDKFEGYVRLQGGTLDNIQAEAAVNIPLGDKASLRVAGFTWHRKGYTRTLGGRIDDLGVTLPSQDINNQQVTEVRATLLLKPSDTFTNSTIFTYHTDKNRGSQQAQFINPGSPTGAPIPIAAIDPRVTQRLFDTNVDLSRQASHTWAVINTTTLDVSDNITIKNIASHISAAGITASPSDYDGIGSGPIASLQDGLRQPRINHNYQTTDELQLQGKAFDGKLEYIIGGLYDQTRQPGSREKINFFGVTFSAFNPAATPINLNFIQSNLTSKSAFGSLTYHLTDTLTVSGGARHTWDSVTQVTASALSATVQSTVPTGTPLVSASTKFQGWTYNAGVQYQPTSATLIYGGYRHGYKRGGFNTQPGVANQTAFGRETNDDFYLGIKQNLNVLGVRGNFNIEGFYDTYKGAQRVFLTLSPNGLATQVANADKSTYRGFDMDFSIDPTDWLSLSGNYTFVDSKYNKFTDRTLIPFLPAPTSTSTDLSGNPVGNISRNKTSLSARFHADLADGSNIAFATTFNYQSKFYFDDYARRVPLSQAQLFLGGQQINQESLGIDVGSGYSTADLRAEWNKIGGSNFDLAANVNNLFNKKYLLTGNTLYAFGVQASAYGPPRLFTVDVRFHW